jgi:predicted dienelactone hydrolase
MGGFRASDPKEIPMSRSRLHTAACLLAVLFLALSLSTPVSAGNGPISEADALGSWAVGRTTFEVVDPDRDDRTLAVDAWYPVDPDAADGPPSVYDLLFAGIVSEVAFDEPPVSAEGPFPLVVFSHGNNGIRFQSFFLTEHLASHGMIVVAPDHAGNTALDAIFGGPPFESRDRPLDVSLLITRMLERSIDAADPFFGRVDPLRIGVTGHSFGGFTTLAMATGFQDIPPDLRVGAIMPISPASNAFSDEDLAEITVPMFVLGGTADITTPVVPQSVRPFSFASSRPRYRVDLEKAGHSSFTNICDIADALIGAGIPPGLIDLILGNVAEGCAPDLIPIEEAHRITNLYAAAFFNRNLVGDPRYQHWLTPGRVHKEGLPVQFFVVNGGGNAGGR